MIKLLNLCSWSRAKQRSGSQILLRGFVCTGVRELHIACGFGQPHRTHILRIQWGVMNARGISHFDMWFVRVQYVFVRMCEPCLVVLVWFAWVLQTVWVIQQDDSYCYWMRQRSVIPSVHPSIPASLCVGRARLERERGRRSGLAFLEGNTEW